MSRLNHWVRSAFVAAITLATGLPALGQVGAASAPAAMVDGAATRPVVAAVTEDPLNHVGDPVFVTITLRNQATRDQIVKNLSVKIDAMADQRFSSVGECALSGLGEGIGSPVMLTVVDFSGGVLIGLFSYPLASWISSTLKLDGVFVMARPKGTGPATLDPPSPQDPRV